MFRVLRAQPLESVDGDVQAALGDGAVDAVELRLHESVSSKQPTLSEAILERGFAVVPGFLDADSVSAFADVYREGLALETQAYALGFAPPERIDPIRPRIDAMLADVRSRHFAPRDYGGGVFFATAKDIDFGWHQDHESYYLHQTHCHYLNLYIAVEKPRRDKSNLSIVPIDPKPGVPEVSKM